MHQGFVEVSPTDEEGATRVTILSDVAELPEAIDTARAESAKTRAEEALRSDPDDVEAQAALSAPRSASRSPPFRRDSPGTSTRG